jgi:hypothetical protein
MSSLREQLQTLPAYQPGPAPTGRTNAQIKDSWNKRTDANTDILTSWLKETLAPPRTRHGTRRPGRAQVLLKKIGGGYFEATISLRGTVSRGIAIGHHEAISRALCLSGGRKPLLGEQTL